MTVRKPSGLHLTRPSSSVRERVHETLHEAILNTVLEPGQRLVERTLMEELGASRATVREVLRDLTAEGLVTLVPHRGAVVSATPSMEEASDLYAARASIDSLVVRLFVERATRSQIFRLEAALEAYAELIDEATEDRAALLKAKDDFDDILLDGARSPTIRQVSENLRHRVRQLRIRALGLGYSQTIAELRVIVAAIRSSDAARASELYAEQLLEAGARALAAIGDGASPPSPAASGDTSPRA